MTNDERCPSCSAEKDERVDSSGFGPIRTEVCGRCGFEFPRREKKKIEVTQ